MSMEAVEDPARLAREIATLEHALAAGGDAGLWKRLGMLRSRCGDWRGAAAAFQRAIVDAGQDPGAWQGLARAHFARADLPAARQACDELLQRFPERAFSHLFAGHLHKAVGDSACATSAYRRALDLAPRLGETLYALVDLNPHDAADLADTAAAVAGDARAPLADRVNAAFARARLHDHDRQYAPAMRYFALANDLARDDLAAHGIRYRPRDVEAEVDAALEAYPAGSFRHGLEPLPIELTPVFVLGLPRSGTTLIEQILAAHPRVQAGGELTAGPECERWFRARRLAAGRHGPIEAADAALLADVRDRYLDALFERGLDAERVVDKLPGNFRIAGFLRLLFPDAPLLHSRRDPRATGWSLYSSNFGGHEPYYHDLQHLAHYHGQYRRLMAHWQGVLPGSWYDVQYESLVQDPERAIPALLAAVGLERHPACLDFHQLARPVFTASHAQVRRPMNTAAIDHWRHYRAWLGPVADLEDAPSAETV